MPRTHRVVRIGDVDQRRINFTGFGQQPVQILVIIQIGNGFDPRAQTLTVKIERRIGPIGSHDGRSRFQKQTAERPQQAVDSATNHDILGPDAMMSRQSGAQREKVSLPVFPYFRDSVLHRGDCHGGWSKDILVRADAGMERSPALALNRLGADKRDRCGKL